MSKKKSYYHKIKDKKIREAVKRGDLMPYDEIFTRYSKERQEKIKARARYLMAAMELRKLRKDMKLSQGDLAKKMRVKREFIVRIESGRQNITLETLYKIAEATGKEVSLVFK